MAKKTDKQILFERMNKVAGMPLNENFPIGADEDPNAPWNELDDDLNENKPIDDNRTIYDVLDDHKEWFKYLDYDESYENHHEESDEIKLVLYIPKNIYPDFNYDEMNNYVYNEYYESPGCEGNPGCWVTKTFAYVDDTYEDENYWKVIITKNDILDV